MSGRNDFSFRVRTPEGVVFSHRLASPASRMLALLVDWLVVSAAWSVASVLFVLLAIASADVARAVSVVGYFVVSLGYWIWFEWGRGGQTPGKRMLRLRVIDARGLRLTFAQVVLRNVMRCLDLLPVAYMAGGITALLNRLGQRLGDLAAGTLVIWEPAGTAPGTDLLQGGKYNTLRAHVRAVARLRHAVAPDEARVAWQALARRDRLDDAARVELFGGLAARFKALAALPEGAAEGLADEQFVRNVVDVLYVERRVEGRRARKAPPG